MIFITLGSQKFQFNRILKEVDRLIEQGKLNEEVFAQIGYSDYEPKNYGYKKFLDRDEYNYIMNKCDKVITHGGTGAIIRAIKEEKYVLAIPRLKEFGEHVDDHQIEIVSQFEKLGFINSIDSIDKLENNIYKFNLFKIKKYISNTDCIINSIDTFIRE